MTFKTKIEPLRTVLDRALAFHEAFRRLNFTSEEIFVGYDPHQVALVSVMREGKQFSVVVGRSEFTPDEFRRVWAERVEWWNGRDDQPAKDALWEDSGVKGHAFELVTALVAKGFTLSAPVEALN